MFYMKLGTYAGTLDKIALSFGLMAGFLFGGWTHLLTAFLMLQGLDILTGLLIGTKNKDVSSSRMHEGIKKKVGSWIALILANVIDMVIFDGQSVAITGLAFVMISNEGLSLVENLGILGIAMPDFITQYLEQVRKHKDTIEYNTGNVPTDSKQN